MKNQVGIDNGRRDSSEPRTHEEIMAKFAKEVAKLLEQRPFGCGT